MWPFTMFRRWREQREAKVLAALPPPSEKSGFTLMEDTGIGPGRLYPLLMRMERDGRLVSRWGQATAERGWHRPRLYRQNVA